MLWLGHFEVNMFCELKSDLKLASNVVTKAKGDRIGLYIPVDLKKKEDLDVRVIQNLTAQQRTQLDKSLFYAKKIVDSKKRFFDLPENKEMCYNCPHKDICF